MTIIDLMRQKLIKYPKVSESLVDGSTRVGFTTPGSSYSLSSSGDSLVKKDLLDSQIRRHNFAMYAVMPSFTDYCRLTSSNLLLELGYWLNSLLEEYGSIVDIGNRELGIRFLKAATSNAMVMRPMDKTINDGILYQTQIQVTYKIGSEES